MLIPLFRNISSKSYQCRNTVFREHGHLVKIYMQRADENANIGIILSTSKFGRITITVGIKFKQ